PFTLESSGISAPSCVGIDSLLHRGQMLITSVSGATQRGFLTEDLMQILKRFTEDTLVGVLLRVAITVGLTVVLGLAFILLSLFIMWWMQS
ncbi:MAG: hypothetical protein AAB899_00945, partial [Patescibacteria group bacterium]